MRAADGNIENSIETIVKIEHDQVPLLDALRLYSQKDISCFDVPGHVRNQGVDILNKYFGNEIMKMDINSSPLMDNIANPNGIIKDAQDLLAKAYGSDEAFFITNGTTQAIHVMILSSINQGDKVLLPRNIHKSVINALILCGGVPVFIQPEYDYEFGISLNLSVDQIKKSLEENSNIKALFLLNPTYYGACTDLEEVVKMCHKKSILVLVDEAHGAHFPFHKDLPPSSIRVGADMSAVSIHKTGGALTQASALLVNNKNIDSKKVLQTINILQSTSASYLLMSSIDGARYNLMVNGEAQLSKALNLSRYAKSKLSKIKGIKVTSSNIMKNEGVNFLDETKLCINVKGLNLTGFEVYDLLYQEFSIQVELGDLYNILALVSIGTTKGDIDRLVKSLSIIAQMHSKNTLLKQIEIKRVNPKIKLSPREAFYSNKESIDIKKSKGKICAESIMAYPPGIPIIAPGEVITEEIIDYINLLKENNAYLTDMKDKTLKTILIVSEG